LLAIRGHQPLKSPHKTNERYDTEQWLMSDLIASIISARDKDQGIY